MNQPSLADLAVCVLASVGSMDDGITNDHPMRHAVRSMKRTAEQILSDAMRQATDLAFQSKQMIRDFDAEMESAQQGKDGAE